MFVVGLVVSQSTIQDQILVQVRNTAGTDAAQMVSDLITNTSKPAEGILSTVLGIVTLVGVTAALVAIARRNVQAHRKFMQRVYLGACVGAGLFTLLPGRYLGDLLWHHGLGLM